MVCQEPHPERFDLAGARVVRPELSAGCCPPSCSTATRGSRRSYSRTSPRRSGPATCEANVDGGARGAAGRPRLREPRPARRGRRARRPARRSRSRRTARSSSTRCAAARSSSSAGGAALADARAVFVGSEHIREVLEEVVGHVDRVYEVPPGVDVDEFRPESRATRRSPACSRRPARPAEPGERGRAAAGRGQRRAARGVLRRPTSRPSSTSASCCATRACTCSSRRCVTSMPARSIVGFGDYRAELEAMAPPRHALHRRARAPPPRAPAAALRRRRRAVDLPRGVRDGRRRGGRGRLPAARRAPFRPRRGRRRARGGVPAPSGAALASFAERRRRRPRGQARRAARAPRRRAAALWASRTADRGRALELGERRRAPAGAVPIGTTLSAAMGDEQRLPYEELLACGARALRRGGRLHAGRRGGVRAPRPGDARARRTASRRCRLHVARARRSRSTSSAS